MKLLYNSGAVVALVFGALGLFQWMFSPNDPSRYLLSFLTGLSLALLVNTFHIYDRIAALEKRNDRPASPDTSNSFNL
jgi:hypothetical protein